MTAAARPGESAAAAVADAPAAPSCGRPAAARNWRKLNNAIHRDAGYLAFGLTIVYAISGLAVNHRADWNPSYRFERRALRIEPIRATEREEIVGQARAALSLGEPRNSFRPDPETLQLFYRGLTYSIDLPTGAVLVEGSRGPCSTP